MANWIKLEAYMEFKSDIYRREQLGINDDEDTEPVFNFVMVDANKIMSYAPNYDNDETDSATTQSEIIFDNGGFMTVKMPFEELDKLIKNIPNV